MSSLVQRITGILLKPKQTWLQIAAEETDITTLYTQYIMILALIPSIASFIGMSLVGPDAGGHTALVPLFNGVLSMVVGYVLSLAMFYLLALLAERLATNFAGEKNRVAAMKLIAYSSTSSMVGGIFSLFPALWFFGWLTSLYSLYLLFLGVPIVMKSPQEKALPYTVVLLIGSLIAGAVLGIIAALFR